MSRPRTEIVRAGAAVSYSTAQRAAERRAECQCGNRRWTPPHPAVPACTTCANGAVYRYYINVGYPGSVTTDDPLFVFYGRQTLESIGTCQWASQTVTYGTSPAVTGRWVLDLSTLPPTLTLDLGVYGVLIYDLDAPSFGCQCPTPFVRRCVRNPLPAGECQVCVTTGLVECDLSLVPETLFATFNHTAPNLLNGVSFALQYEADAAVWGPGVPVPRWVGETLLANGVRLILAVDVCADTCLLAFSNCSNTGFPNAPPWGYTDVLLQGTRFGPRVLDPVVNVAWRAASCSTSFTPIMVDHCKFSGDPVIGTAIVCDPSIIVGLPAGEPGRLLLFTVHE